MIISVDLDAPTSPDMRTPWYVGGIVVAIVGVLAVVFTYEAVPSPDPAPTPTPHRDAAPLTGDEQTYLLYQSWLAGKAFADCMATRGFEREAVAGAEHGRVAAVAAYLGVEPVRPQTWLAPAEARSGRVRPAAARTDDLFAALKDADAGGCRASTSPGVPRDPNAAPAAVASARVDAGFTGYLAEAAWLDENPAESLLYETHVLMATADSGVPTASDRWSADLAATMSLVDGMPGWSEGPSEGYLDLAQAVAVADDGSMFVVRVGDPAVIDHGFVSNVDEPMIDCGGVGVAVGFASAQRARSDDDEPYRLLSAQACDTLRR